MTEKSQKATELLALLVEVGVDKASLQRAVTGIIDILYLEDDVSAILFRAQNKAQAYLDIAAM